MQHRNQNCVENKEEMVLRVTETLVVLLLCCSVGESSLKETPVSGVQLGSSLHAAKSFYRQFRVKKPNNNNNRIFTFKINKEINKSQ